MKKKKKIIILGAGPAGLISGWFLAKKKYDVEIYEMQKSSGGMCRSWKWNGHIIDTGPHIFHSDDHNLIKFWKKNFSDILEEGKYFAKNILGFNLKNSYEYPVSKQSINKYPKEIKKKIFNELRLKKRNYTAKNFKEFVEGQVGKTLTKMFFEGYPEKVWGLKTTELTADWAPKRITITDKTQPFFQKQFTAVSKFGTGNFYKKIEKEILKRKGKIFFDSKVTKLKTQNNLIKEILINSKNKIQVNEQDTIISTLPISLTSFLLGQKSQLKFNGVRSVYVSLKKQRVLPKKVNWLYFPDKGLIFNRVSEASTMTKTVSPKNKTYLTCEISFSKNDEIDKMSFDEIKKRVKKDLYKTTLVKNEKELDSISENKENFVYPVQFVNYRGELAKTKQYVEKFKQIYSLGTGGEFDYADSQIIFHKSMDLADIIDQKYNDETQVKKNTISTKLNNNVKLGSKLVGNGFKPFIIAEAGLNHNGDINLAKKLIDEAKKTNCDAIKFQTYKANSRVSQKVKSVKYFEKSDGLREDIYQMFDRLSLSQKEFKQIFNYANKKKILIFSTPFSKEDVDFLESLNTPFYKLASVDCVNLDLIKKVGQTGKPLILSTGMSDISIIDDAINEFKKTGNKNLIVLHCLSSYPSDIKEMNLRAIETLKNIYKIPVGLSDHSEGIEVALISLGMGANIIERHFTLNKNFEGPDHILSSETKDMKTLSYFAKNLTFIQGDGQKKIQPSEYFVINSQRKCLYSGKNIPKGHVLKKSDIEIKGPGGGLLPKYLDLLIGRKTKKTIKKDYPITWDLF